MSVKDKDVPHQTQSQSSGHLTKPGAIDPFAPSKEAYPLPEDAPDTPAWEKAEFKRRVLEAGFPGSPSSDGAFLSALYRFVSGGKEKEEHKEKK